VADILERCPRLTVLVTSRSVLGLYGEHTFVVPPLVESEAVELFIGRAEAAGAAVSISAESRHVLGTICNRLDRLPLAIELAAARSRVLPPPTLLDRLDRRLPLLAGGGVNQPARLRSMRDAISWSYDLLPTTIQAVVRQLAVFSSGFSLEAAEVVTGSDIVMDGITSLLDASLLNEIGTSDGRMRFAMLETVREFALERLVAAGGEPTARGRHAGWCLGVAEQAATELIGPHERVWLERLAIEHENVRAALNWLLTIGDAETSLRIGAGLYQYWFVRGHVGEGRSWLERALALPQARHIPSPVRTRALYATAMLCSRQRDGVEAVRLAEECLALASATSDDLGVAYALKVLGMDAVARGDHDHARTFLDAAIPLFHTAGDEHAKAIVLMHRGMIANAPDADGYLTEAIATFNAIGHTGGGSAMAIARLGQVARALGNRTRAAELFHEAVERAWDARDVWALPNALECVATVANRERAAKLCGAAEALRETTSTTGRSIARPEHLQALEEVHSWRSSPNIAAAWASGRELSPGEAVAEALSPPVDRF
jgi:predicted ATPase